MTKVAAEMAIMSGGHWAMLLKNKAAGMSFNEPSLKNRKFQMPWYSSALTKKLEFKAISQNSSTEKSSQPEHTWRPMKILQSRSNNKLGQLDINICLIKFF